MSKNIHLIWEFNNVIKSFIYVAIKNFNYQKFWLFDLFVCYANSRDCCKVVLCIWAKKKKKIPTEHVTYFIIFVEVEIFFSELKQ